jgi:polygalacturonase
VQTAIDTRARNGGGVVAIPPGDFLCGTLELKSNVTLRLAASGRLLGSGAHELMHASECIGK